MRSAATGLAKNIVPIREKAMSKPSPSGSAWTSATRKRALATPPRSASARRGLDEARRGVDPDGLAVRPDEPGDALRRVAEPAADVEHALPGLRRHEAQRRLAVRAQARRQDVAEADEAVEERPVPGLDRLGVDPGSPARLSAHGATLRL